MPKFASVRVEFNNRLLNALKSADPRIRKFMNGIVKEEMQALQQNIMAMKMSNSSGYPVSPNAEKRIRDGSAFQIQDFKYGLRMNIDPIARSAGKPFHYFRAFEKGRNAITIPKDQKPMVFRGKNGEWVRTHKVKGVVGPQIVSIAVPDFRTNIKRIIKGGIAHVVTNKPR